MTFDDGILKVCEVVNSAANGQKPKYTLSERARYYFSYDNLGINRYFTALNAKKQIEAVVNIPEWHEIDSRDVIVLEDGRQFRLAMVQPQFDYDNLRITKLSLERINENYEFTADDSGNGTPVENTDDQLGTDGDLES